MNYTLSNITLLKNSIYTNPVCRKDIFSVLIFFLLCFFSTHSGAQTITVTGVSPNPVCAGSLVTVTFTATSGNTAATTYTGTTGYSAWLINTSTGVATPFYIYMFPYTYKGIGLANTGVSGQFTIADNIAAGTYTLSVSSFNPNFDGSTGAGAFSTPVTVYAASTAPTVSGPTNLCPNTSGVYTITPANQDLYEYIPAGSGITLFTFSDNTVTLKWSTPGLKTLTVRYDNNSNQCASRTTVYNIMVDSAAIPYAVTSSGSYCAGGVIIGLANSEIGRSYQLKLNGVDVGTPVAGTGAAINFGGQTVAGTYTVVGTNTASGCSATMTGSVIVTAGSAPSIPNQSATICSQSSFNVTPSSAPAGTTYSWSAPVVTGSITGGAAASGQTSISGTLINPTTTVQTATYTVTPTAAACSGAPFTVTVTVNPKPVIANTTTTACSGVPFDVDPTGVPGNTIYAWAIPTMASGITGGQSKSFQLSVFGTLNNSTTSPQIATYTVTPSAGTCTGSPFTVTVTVLPTQTISNQTATICSGGTFNVGPTGVLPGTTYSWSAPAVTGGLTGGSAGIAQASVSGSLINPTTVTQTATYTVFPDCGPSFTVTVTVDPVPSVTNKTATACSGNAFNVTPAGVPTATTYSWSSPATTGGITGGTPGAAQSSITGTLTNNTSTPQTATYTVTPASGNCTGASFTVTVTVNPIPAGSASPQTICSGTATGVALNATVIGTTFTWTAALQTAPASGTVNGFSNCNTSCGTSIAQIVTNTGTTAGVVRYTITPSANTCAGASFIADVTVNPKPSVTLGANPSVCMPAATAGISYSGITGGANQSSIDFNNAANAAGLADVVNATLNPGNIVIAIPSSVPAGTYNGILTVRNSTTGCISASYPVSVTVNPKPVTSIITK